MRFRPDPSFYPSAKLAMQAPQEEVAYVAILNPLANNRPDAIATVDLNPHSPMYAKIRGRVDMQNIGDELHHFGWNACSSALCPNAPHPHLERRYLIVPGINSSRITILDIKPDPWQPTIYKTIEPDELKQKADCTGPHTVHCGASGIFISALGNAKGDIPGGILVLDHDTFDVRGRWELEFGIQTLAYDFWWNLGYDVMLTSSWATPNMIRNGVDPNILLSSGYGHHMHVWNIPKRRHLQAIDLGKEHQMVLEIRPAHDPARSYGFVCVVLSLEDLSASIWLWYLEGNEWKIKKVITIPAQPANEDQLPPILKPFKAVPPLVTDINLSLDDQMLYVSCWGTGEFHQYDVSDPHHPKLCEIIKLGGIVNRTPHPKNPDVPLNGAPQMVECSRDCKRLYFTNSLYSSWDDQFYPDGIKGWMIKVDCNPKGGMQLDKNFILDFGDERPHQIRLQGGDASSDSFCYS